MNKWIKLLCLGLFSASIVSCNIDTVDNPNGPTVESFANDASESQLQLLVTGTEANMRNDMEFYYQTVSIVGREYYDLNETDPRYTGELLGRGGSTLDNNGFLTTRSFSARYRAIRNAENLITAVTNSNAALTDGEKRGYYGFAKAVKAYQLLLVANRQFQNGVRVETADPDNLGPFLSYDESLGEISDLLSEALADVTASGESFRFNLSSGFSGFDTPATFNQFVQALRARVEMYRGNSAEVRSALASSFLDASGDLYTGPKHIFGAAGNDQLNPIFYVPGQDLYMAHDSYVADAESGDDRLSKVVAADTTITADGLSANFEVNIYTSNVAPVEIIRNEELILLRAESNIGTDNAAAIADLNIVRNAHGLGDYSGDTSDAAVTDELLNQRRYSLFGEGHRWVDMRRYDRLGDLPLDRTGDQVFVQFPRPILETE
jgi:hypothetical protein